MAQPAGSPRGFASMRWISVGLIVIAAAAGVVALVAFHSKDGAVAFQSLTSVRVDSESPIKKISTKKLNGNDFAINVKTKQGSGTGPLLPPKNKLKRWRDVKWWSDDFTKKYYPKHWSLVHKGEKASSGSTSGSSSGSTSGSTNTKGLSAAERARREKLARRKALVVKIAKVNEKLMQGVTDLSVKFDSMETRNITVDASKTKPL